VNKVQHRQRHSSAASPEPHCARRARAHLAVLFATLLGAVSYCQAQHAAAAQHTAAKTDARLDEVVINASRTSDEQISRQVQETLTADPWIFAEHITVTTQNGVVRLEGIVGDTGELFRVLRLARKIPGARRVVNELEMMHNDPDGG
jgi:hypothetical protein